MAEEKAAAVTKTGLAALADTAENLKKVIDSLKQPDPKPADSQPPAPTSDAAGVAELTASLRRAKESYAKTMRWLVGTVGLVGLVLFGSGPFLVGDEFGDLFDSDNRLALVGLASVALGVVMVIVSATRVYEPEDASLGELCDSFDQLADPMLHGPRRDALERLQRILTGPEASAHLGPQCTNVRALIDKIADLQSDHLATETVVQRATRALEAPRERVKALEAALASTEAALASARDRQIKPDEVGGADLAVQRKEMVRRLLDRQAKLTAELSVAKRILPQREQTLEAARVLKASTEVGLDTYLLHRQIVLAESIMTEMRGTFRSARDWLVVGAVFTLLGGVFVLGKAQEKDTKSGSGAGRALLLPAQLTINRAATSAAAMPQECLETALDARYGSLTPPKRGAEFSVTVVAPAACVGTLTVPSEDNKAPSPLVQLVIPTPRPGGP